MKKVLQNSTFNFWGTVDEKSDFRSVCATLHWLFSHMMMEESFYLHFLAQFLTSIFFLIPDPSLFFQVMEEAPPPPVFNLPPPPRPPDLPCPSEDQARPLHGLHSSGRPVKDLFQESCDINYVIDSRLYLGENLFTLLIVLVGSCILVCIVMTVAILIYRYCHV